MSLATDYMCTHAYVHTMHLLIEAWLYAFLSSYNIIVFVKKSSLHGYIIALKGTQAEMFLCYMVTHYCKDR